MKIRTNKKNAAVVLLMTALFAFVGIISHGCSVTEYGEITLDRIEITPVNMSVYSGGTAIFKAEGVKSDTSREDLTSKVTWASSGEEVTIDKAGLATAATVTSKYPCTITATYTDPKTNKIFKDTTTVTVKPIDEAAFNSIEISAPNNTLAMGTSVQFTATGLLDDGSTQGLSSKVTWASSNTAIVEIDAAGKATGKSGGSAQITATYGAKKSNAVEVTVSGESLVSLAVQVAAGGSASISRLETAQFQAIGTFSDNSTQDMSASVTWISSNADVATISAAGLATAKNIDGTTSIKATFGDVTSNEMTLTVSGPALTSIEIITGGDGTASIIAGATKPVTARATYADNSIRDVTMEVTWSSSNLAVGEIVKTANTVTIKASNVSTTTKVTITASMKGKTAQVEFTVSACSGSGGC